MGRKRKLIPIICFWAVAALFFSSCGNPLDGGSSPSGSVLRVTDVSYDGYQDLYFCDGESVAYASATVEIRNDSTPNSEEDTNSFVTIEGYQIEYAVLNLSASIPTIEGSGWTAGVDPNGTVTYSGLPLMRESVLEYIRSNYPEIGEGQSMEVRCDITFYGEDEFGVNTNAKASATISVDDYSPCPTDLEEIDESTEGTIN